MSSHDEIDQRLLTLKTEMLESFGKQLNIVRMGAINESAALSIILRSVLAELTPEQRSAIADRAVADARERSKEVRERVTENLKVLRLT
ncbi:hypothetical protein [Salipiger marinus]|uniref:hypothetical protein n=1 Tax=Salipiger marinus TaxID=555512 RepID=UPI004057FE2B